MKRVLIFSAVYYPHASGAEVALHEMTQRMDGLEFDLICARFQKGLPDSDKFGNVRIHRVGLGMKFDKYLLPFLGPIKALSFDKPDLIWSLMASYGGFAALFYAWMYPRTPMLLTLQEGDPLEHYQKRLGILNPLHRAIFKRSNDVQAISTFLAEWSLKMGFAGSPQVIPNGVPFEHYAKRISNEERERIRQSFGFAASDVVLVHTGRLSKKNAMDDAIKALKQLASNYKLLLIGNGEDEQMLRDLAAELGVTDRVIFAGSKPNPELPPYLQACDIFIRPSLSEGLGNSFLEAMASYVPVIATPVGGIPDFLKDGETGVMCEPRHPESIVQAVHRIMSDAVLRERIIRQGHEMVREGYNWDTLAVRLRKLIESTYE